MKKIILFVIMLLFLVIPAHAEVCERTEFADVYCNPDGTKTMVFGERNLQDKYGRWVDTSDVLYITKQSDDITFHYDGMDGYFDITFETGVIYNGNYFSMQEIKSMRPEIEFSFPSTKYSNHIKYSVEISKIPEDIKASIESITLTYKEHYGFSLSELKTDERNFIVKKMLLLFDDLREKFSLRIDKEERRIYISNIATNIKNGNLLLDPTVTTLDAVEDKYISYNSGGEQDVYSYVKIFNITSVPASSEILNATFEAKYYWSQGWDGKITAWRVDNQEWDSSTSYSTLWGFTTTNQTNFTNKWMGAGWDFLNVTDMFITDFEASNQNFSIKMCGTTHCSDVPNSNGASNYLWIGDLTGADINSVSLNSKEYPPASRLNVTYIYDDPNVTIVSPANDQVFNDTTTVLLNFSVVNKYSGNLTCWRELSGVKSLIGNVSNNTYSATNIINLTDGNYILNVICQNDVPSNGTDSVNFTVYTWDNPYLLNNCSLGYPYNTTALRFYGFDESNNDPLTFSMDINLEIWRADNTSRTNFSFEFRNQNNYSICIFPEWQSYYTDTISLYFADGYSTRYYYMDDAVIDNTTGNINLYLLNTSDSTQITMTVLDQVESPVDDIIILIQKQDVGSGTFTQVAEAKSDFSGNAYAYLELHEIYKFILTEAGVVVKEYLPMQLETNTLTFYISTVEIPEYFSYYGKVATSCNFDNSTNLLTCNYVDTSGLTMDMAFKVYRIGQAGETLLCNETSSGASGTFQCNLTANYTYSYNLMGTYYSDPTVYLWQSGWINLITGIVNFGAVGLLIAFVLTGFSSCLAIYDVRVAVILAGFSTIFSIFAGFIQGGVEIMVIMLSIIAITGIIAFKIKT